MDEQDRTEMSIIFTEELSGLLRVANAFEHNIRRLLNMLNLSKRLEDRIKDDQAFQSYIDDVLRSTVVSMHSTLEHTLREIIRLELKKDETLQKISVNNPPQPLTGIRKEIYDYLLKHESATVEDAIDEYLAVRSFGDTNKIEDRLQKAGFKKEDLKRFQKYYSSLDKMIQRRHNIVHEADMEDGGKSEKVRPIEMKVVNAWVENTNNYYSELIRFVTDYAYLDKIVERLKNKGISLDRRIVLKKIFLED